MDAIYEEFARVKWKKLLFFDWMYIILNDLQTISMLLTLFTRCYISININY